MKLVVDAADAVEVVEAVEAVEAIEPDAVMEFETPEIEALDEGIIESGALEEIVEETVVEALEDKVTEPVAVETTPEVVDADVDAALVAMTPS
ncbi:hypothetical protein NE685_12315 [Cutibacterium acnes]|nr:hypothetical protein [Cutibacterium acnes]